jgi:hypothetical protein
MQTSSDKEIRQPIATGSQYTQSGQRERLPAEERSADAGVDVDADAFGGLQGRMQGLENTGSASSGHPIPLSSLYKTLAAMNPTTSVSIGAASSSRSAERGNPRPLPEQYAYVANDLSFFGQSETAKRALQRKADSEYAAHKKSNDGSKFTIHTDIAGNIKSNKLKVTSLLNHLMGLYLNVAQIHYDDDDEKFVLIEKIVRKSFDFVPGLKSMWMVEYMKKKMEKSRSVFRKHFDETGQRHPACPVSKFPMLLAWWTSPNSHNRGQRMREFNATRAAERKAKNQAISTMTEVCATDEHFIPVRYS